MTAGVEMPESFAGGRVESEEIAGVVGAEKEMSGRSQDSRDTLPVSDFVVPDDFTRAVVERAQCRIRPKIAVTASPPFRFAGSSEVIHAKDPSRIDVEKAGLGIEARRHPIAGAV